MKPLPYFCWYPADAESDENFRLMTNEEVGIYLRCLNHAWLNGGLPTQCDRIASVLREKTETVERTWLAVGKCFTLSDDGTRYVNPRQELERLKAMEKRDKTSKSARSRWHPDEAACNANAMRTQCEGNARDEAACNANAMRTQCEGNARAYESDSLYTTNTSITEYKSTGTNSDPDYTDRKLAIVPTENEPAYWAERLYARHPRKKNLVLVQSWVCEAFDRFPSPVEKFREIDASHIAHIDSEEWTRQGGRFVPSLDKWLSDRGWENTPKGMFD